MYIYIVHYVVFIVIQPLIAKSYFCKDITPNPPGNFAFKYETGTEKKDTDLFYYKVKNRKGENVGVVIKYFSFNQLLKKEVGRDDLSLPFSKFLYFPPDLCLNVNTDNYSLHTILLEYLQKYNLN